MKKLFLVLNNTFICKLLKVASKLAVLHMPSRDSVYKACADPFLEDSRNGSAVCTVETVSTGHVQNCQLNCHFQLFASKGVYFSPELNCHFHMNIPNVYTLGLY